LIKRKTIKLVVWLKVRGIVVPVPVCCVVPECRTRGVETSHVVNICILQEAAERSPLFGKLINSKPKKIRQMFFYFRKVRRMPFQINDKMPIPNGKSFPYQ
jgi:hypothetical protein